MQTCPNSDQDTNKRLKVLFLASWYPNKEHPVSGIFIRRHAHAISKYCDIAVLYINIGKSDDGLEISRNNGIIEIRVYRRMRESHNPYVKKVYNYLLVYIDYLIGGYKGYKVVEREFGRPHLAHVNVAIYAGLIGLALKFFHKIPYVLTEHWAGYLQRDGGFYKHSIIGRHFILAVARNSQAIITVSSALKDAMISCGAKGRFYVIPNVVDLECGASDLSSENQEKKIITHISLMKDDVKNISGIVEAVAVLSQSRSDFEFHILGYGPDENKIMTKSKDFGLLDKTIFFHGMVNAQELARFLSKSAFTVINSNFETFCVAAAESLYCGIPVIATKCGGPEEFVDEQSGILIKCEDKAALISALNYMLDHHSEFDSRQISKKARSLFGSEIVGKKIYDLYKEVLGWNG